jgi:peptidyl-prolyl cis-trans isomerase D
MLQSIRNQAASWVVKLLFVLLILSFGAWGVTDYMNAAGKRSTPITVGDATIDPNQVSQAVNAEVQRMRQFLGPQFSREQAKAFGIVDSVLDGLVVRALLEQEGKRIGVTVSDELVRQTIQSDPVFAGPTGQFDRNRFGALISRAGYTEDRYIAELRRDLARNQLVRPLADPGATPTALVNTLMTFREERRVADYFLLPPEAAGEIPAPDRPTLEAFHTKESSRFSSPEYRKLTILKLDADSIAAEIAVTDLELEASYAARTDEFVTPERRVIDQMLFNDEAAATSAKAKLDSGAAFVDVARDDAKMTPDQIALGSLAKSELPAEIADAVFAAPAGGVVAPIRTAFGWSLARVVAVAPETRRSFADVKDGLAADLKRERALDLVFQRSTKLEDLLFTGASLDDAAKQFGLTLITIPAVDRRGRTPDGAAEASLPDGVLQAAFNQPQGGTSALLSLDPERFAAVRVDGVTPVAVKPLDSVLADVTDAWTAAEREKRLAALADKLAAEVKGGKAIAAVAEEAKATFAKTDPIGRDGAGSPLAQTMTAPLFAGAVGAVLTGQRGESYIVAQLAEIVALSAEAAEEKRKAQARQLRDGVGDDILQQLQAALRKRYPVSIDRRVIESL